ncbi:MAG: cytochrome c [Bacteroidetes bacterium]|nr:cytochrome c [Bacteroidota bacterium]MCZ2131684.1 cytochrome c [Bacteroidota bacterium]
MKRFYSHQLILSLAFFSAIFLAGCNIKGFFIKSSDDPVWVEPGKPAASAEGEASVDMNSPGAKVYKRICNACHGESGKGMAGIYPPLAGSALMQGDAAKPIKIVLHGFSGKIEREGQTYNGVMTGWGAALSDQDIADVLTFVRSSFGNTAGAVTASEVKGVRDATAGHSKPMAESEL